MNVQSIESPKYLKFIRRDIEGKQIETNGIDILIVPRFLAKASFNPFYLSKWVNGFNRVAYVNSSRIEDNENTSKDRITLNLRSPRVMRTSKSKELYERISKPGSRVLTYQKFGNDGVLVPYSPSDYISGFDAAKRYAMAVELCKFKKDFDILRNEGIIQPFSTELPHNFRGPQGFGTKIKLYLLSDLNDLKE